MDHVVRDRAAQPAEIYTFFALVIVLSWAFVLAGGLPDIGASAEERAQWHLSNGWVILWAPMLLALVCVMAFRGLDGLKSILRRVIRFRVRPRYYLFALLSGPVVAAIIGIALTVLGQEVMPRVSLPDLLKSFATYFGMLALLIIGEELGWRGYAQPGLQGTMSPLRAAVTVGVVWGIWHWPVWYGVSGDAMGSSPFALAMLAVMTGMTVMMSITLAWLVNRTGASIPIAMIWHGSHNAALALLVVERGALSVSLASLVVWGVVAWVLVRQNPEEWRSQPGEH